MLLGGNGLVNQAIQALGFGPGKILYTETAIVIPMIKAAGFDLVWFGIFLVLIVEMAEVSPPVGFNLFVLQTMSGKDSNTVALAALPFFFLLVAAVAIAHAHGRCAALAAIAAPAGKPPVIGSGRTRHGSPCSARRTSDPWQPPRKMPEGL